MAKIGLKYIVAKGVTSFVVGKAIQADVTINISDVKLRAEDTVAESDKSFIDGSITIGVDDLSDVMQVEFLGHTLATEEITAKSSDQSPYVGIGFYATKVVGGVRSFRAFWFPKVQFGEPSDTNATKGDTISFNTPTIVGTIIEDSNGIWKKEQTFTSEAEAVTYLNTASGIVVTP